MNKMPIERTIESKAPETFAVINKNEKIRMDSSSGGIFTLVAEKIINDGGVVFGARFNEHWEAIHDCTKTIEGMAVFRGSKYVQSTIGDSYKNVKKFLEEGKNVLFTGTPCQIGGLKFYLQKEYEKLICIDIICHGVPSPKVWKKYVDFREKIAGSKLREIALRHKNCGWMCFFVLFVFENETEYRKIHRKDLFIQAFLKDLCLRPSCYQCGFKTINRISDITIADFWGVQNIAPEMFDDKGTSLVLLQSSKGRDIFDKIKSDACYMEVACEKSLQFNKSAFRSCAEPRKRGKFMENIDRFPFDKLVKKYAKLSLAIRIKRLIVALLCRLGLLTFAKSRIK
jgi:coenzyme F420-reducing hydrogenase beta subunit